MKTIFKISAVVAFMLSTVVSMANEPKVNLVASTQAKSLVLTLQSTSEDFIIKFIDEEEHTIYSESLSKGTFIKKFNLKNLKDGIYYISTSDELRSDLYTISLKGNDVKILSKKEALKPFFRKTNDRLFISFLNLNEAKVGIKVYDADYRVVYFDAVDDKIIVEKAFNFEDAYAGSYSVVVSNGSKTYTKEFIVD